jgi:hypothetical protein
MSSYYDRIDVLKNRALCVDVRAVQFVHDWGPVPPSDTSREAMRRYHAEREEWLQATGGKPYRIALNSVDAQAALRHRRYSRSPTEREPVQVQPQTTTPQQFVYIGCGGQTLPCGHISDLMNPGVTLVVFGVDYYPILAADARYQPVRAP